MNRNIFLTLSLLFSIFLFASTAAATTSLTYEYDTNGNLIQGDGKYYEYNDANQLVRVRHGDQHGPVIAEYFYDYTGQRIKKIEDGATTYYIGKHYETQVDGDSQNNISYYFANGERVAKKDSLGNVFYHSDHLGGTNAVTDSTGNLVERTKYYPFGEIREGGNEKYSFTGKEKDKLTDFYYFEARYYNPEFKHFTQADIIAPKLYDPQDLNRYAYVRNNPLKFVDPTGHFTDPSGRHWNKEENYYRWRAAIQEQAKYAQEAAKAQQEYADMLSQGELMKGIVTEAGELGKDISKEFVKDVSKYAMKGIIWGIKKGYRDVPGLQGAVEGHIKANLGGSKIMKTLGAGIGIYAADKVLDTMEPTSKKVPVFSEIPILGGIFFRYTPLTSEVIDDNGDVYIDGVFQGNCNCR